MRLFGILVEHFSKSIIQLGSDSFVENKVNNKHPGERIIQICPQIRTLLFLQTNISVVFSSLGDLVPLVHSAN